MFAFRKVLVLLLGMCTFMSEVAVAETCIVAGGIERLPTTAAWSDGVDIDVPKMGYGKLESFGSVCFVSSSSRWR